MELDSISVLLIEDDRVDQMAFKRMIDDENMPYKYTIAGSLKEGMSYILENSYDIIIADYQLGDGTAFEIFDYVNNAPIIIATGVGDEVIAVKAMKMGAYDYIIKDSDRNYLQLLPITIDKAIQFKKIDLKHKKAEKGSVENRKKFEAVFRSNPEPTVYLNNENRVLDINPRFIELFGFELKEIQGKNINDVLVPDDHKKEALDLDSHSIEGYVYYDTIRSKKDGTRVDVSVSAAPIMLDGDNLGVVVHYKNISDKKKIEANQKKLIQDLQAALEEVKTLSGLIPICAHCKKIRDDKGYWTSVEQYISSHTDIDFSHAICPDCIKEHFPKIYNKMKDKGKI